MAADLLGGLTNPTAILETFKNEARKILNEIANKQADELVQGIIRTKVEENMKTIFNSGYVQQAAASAFNSTIYPEYIRRLKNLEAFLKLSSEQDNGLKEQLNKIPNAERTPDKIIEAINTWANGLKPTMEEIQAKIKGPPSTDFNTTGDILAILGADKESETTYETQKKEADTNNVAEVPMQMTQNPLTQAVAQNPLTQAVAGQQTGNMLSSFLKKGGKKTTQGKKTKRNRTKRRRQRNSQRIN